MPVFKCKFLATSLDLGINDSLPVSKFVKDIVGNDSPVCVTIRFFFCPLGALIIRGDPIEFYLVLFTLLLFGEPFLPIIFLF